MQKNLDRARREYINEASRNQDHPVNDYLRLRRRAGEEPGFSVQKLVEGLGAGFTAEGVYLIYNTKTYEADATLPRFGLMKKLQVSHRGDIKTDPARLTRIYYTLQTPTGRRDVNRIYNDLSHEAAQQFREKKTRTAVERFDLGRELLELIALDHPMECGPKIAETIYLPENRQQAICDIARRIKGQFPEYVTAEELMPFLERVVE